MLGCSAEIGHTLLRGDANILGVWADEFTDQTLDPSVFTTFGVGGSHTNGDQPGLQIYLAGTNCGAPTAPNGCGAYHMVVSTDTNTLIAEDVLAQLNGSLRAVTVANGGSGNPNGTYTATLTISSNPVTAAAICPNPPTVTITVSGGVVTAIAPAASAQSGIWGGWCIAAIPNPTAVPIAGTNATASVTQADLTIAQAFQASQDAHGYSSHATGFMFQTTVGSFDLPAYAGNYVAVCGAAYPASHGRPGVACPTASPTETVVLGSGYSLDVSPLVVYNRIGPPGRCPIDGDKIFQLTANSVTSSAGGNQVYGTVLAEIGGNGAQTAGATAAGGFVLTIATININAATLGAYVTDESRGRGVIAPCTTVVSGQGTASVTMSNAALYEGVQSGDTLAFNDPLAPQGMIILGANNGIGGAATGIQLRVSGAPQQSDGANLQLQGSQNSNLVMSVLNNLDSANAQSIIQVVTGARVSGQPVSYANFSMADNCALCTLGGRPLSNASMTTGPFVFSYTNNMTQVLDGGKYLWENGPFGHVWMTLTSNGLNLGVPIATTSTAPPLVGSTFTPIFSASNDFHIVLVSGSCPCTLANPLSAKTETPTAASGNGTTAVITYAGGVVAAVGSPITTTGMTPAGYNVSGAIVTASSAGSVSFANATTGALTAVGQAVIETVALTPEQSGMIEIKEGSAGSDGVGFVWGSEFRTPGGTSGITLSTGVGVTDLLPYYVDSTGTFIVLGAAERRADTLRTPL